MRACNPHGFLAKLGNGAKARDMTRISLVAISGRGKIPSGILQVQVPSQTSLRCLILTVTIKNKRVRTLKKLFKFYCILTTFSGFSEKTPYLKKKSIFFKLLEPNSAINYSQSNFDVRHFLQPLTQSRFR